LGPKGGGDVTSREILNGKLSSGLDALAGMGEEEKLNDNRDFNCLVRPYPLRRVFLLLEFDVVCCFVVLLTVSAPVAG